DSANLIRLMGSLSPAPQEDPAIALDWTQRYQLKAFCERVHATLEELR
ncbi:glycosyl transferase, group 1 family protein PslI, partial [Pseudomonas syringae pv. actinidiae ICMP 18804]